MLRFSHFDSFQKDFVGVCVKVVDILSSGLQAYFAGILLLAFSMVNPMIFPSLRRIIAPSSVMSESSASWGSPKLM